LTDLDKRSLSAADSLETSGQVAGQLAAVWDTMGWIYFLTGNTAQAEKYVLPSWELDQSSVVGNHLGQIYEKLGKTKDAAHAFELALAALPPVRLAPGLDSSKAYNQSRDDITSRYKKLTGKAPSSEIRRLPNGEWTKTPFEQLSEMRTTHLGKLAGVTGSAEFSILFAPEKIESVQYVSGQESLKTLSDKLKVAHFQCEFPEDSKARILRRAELSCTPTVGCMAVLVPPGR
jgi:tetratricopeptide (TPR) repeat protein